MIILVVLITIVLVYFVLISKDNQPNSKGLSSVKDNTSNLKSGSASQEFVANGWNGQLILRNDKIVISRRGFGSFITKALSGQSITDGILLGATQGEKEISVTEITTINFKNADWVGNGFIQFAIKGYITVDPLKDENNTIFFKKNQENDFIIIRDILNNKVGSLPTLQTNQIQLSEADEIEKFAKLRDKGIITEEEFAAKKKKIIGI